MCCIISFSLNVFIQKIIAYRITCIINKRLVDTIWNRGHPTRMYLSFDSYYFDSLSNEIPPSWSLGYEATCSDEPYREAGGPNLNSQINKNWAAENSDQKAKPNDQKWPYGRKIDIYVPTHDWYLVDITLVHFHDILVLNLQNPHWQLSDQKTVSLYVPTTQ